MFNPNTHVRDQLLFKAKFFSDFSHWNHLLHCTPMKLSSRFKPQLLDSSVSYQMCLPVSDFKTGSHWLMICGHLLSFGHEKNKQLFLTANKPEWESLMMPVCAFWIFLIYISLLRVATNPRTLFISFWTWATNQIWYPTGISRTLSI